MKHILFAAMLAVFIAPLGATTALAGPIDRACLASPRQQKSRQLCGCIQRVANQTLSRRDQRLAAKFFVKPHMAQEIRQSDSRSHEIFWLRYKEFGAAAAATCS
ncbi:hypothetical protein [Thalassovita taeanensis]|uniref:Secreted protein n=1 Tax=Thalassovita taeanensis TaxID=657014 RepID=A0A1H9D885_9RHOB|nr:hypothetical protein [Thalassovita taeanensis]SEQ09571.1 hypothetical protein SAMN04488092_10446 [Thalassovita taeanensis]